MQRPNPLARLRKHRAVLGRVLLATFTTACLGVSAAPCPVAAAQAAAAAPPASTHCHDAPSASQPDATSPAAHDATSSSAHEGMSSSFGHDAMSTPLGGVASSSLRDPIASAIGGANGGHGQSHVPSAPMPHCAHCAPTLDAGAGASPACAAAVAVGGAPASDSLVAVHWLPALPPSWSLVPPKPPHPPPRAHRARAARASVALNVRHCVFLI